LITTSPESHGQLAEEAMREGADVLIEKPMVLLPAEADRLLELASRLGRRIRVGFNRRFRPAYMTLRRLAATQPAHALHSIHFELCSDPVGWQSVSRSSGLSGPTGGVLVDIASHQLDLLPWLLQRQVVALRASRVQHDTRYDLVGIDLRFADGVTATCLAGHQPHFVERLEMGLGKDNWIAGPGGLSRVKLLPRSTIRRYLELRSAARAAGRKIMKRPGDTLETFVRQYQVWATQLTSDGNSPPATVVHAADGAAGARAVALVDACRQSVETGGNWVDVPGPLLGVGQ
jgi:predicted dehydrogenase